MKKWTEQKKEPNKLNRMISNRTQMCSVRQTKHSVFGHLLYVRFIVFLWCSSVYPINFIWRKAERERVFAFLFWQGCAILLFLDSWGHQMTCKPTSLGVWSLLVFWQFGFWTIYTSLELYQGVTEIRTLGFLANLDFKRISSIYLIKKQ